MKTFFDSKTEWLNTFLKKHVPDKYQILNKHVLESDFGECVGIDFETNEKAGYVYFWSSGMVGFGLVDMTNSRPIIDLEFIELNDSDALPLLSPLIEML